MNQDQVKEMLLRVRDAETEFSVTFTGKKSTMVNGLYKPETREILLHNKNFETDQQLIYTALHEYAHHLHAEKKGFVKVGRPHSNEFWALFHELLEDAEEAGVYRNLFAEEPAFVDMTARIRAVMPKNGEAMLEFGRLVAEAAELCRTHCVRFEDYLDRALGVPRASAGAAMRAYNFQVPADLGWDAMKLVSGIRDPGGREAAVDAFRAGKSTESVKSLFKKDPDPEDPRDRLAKERSRLEKTIKTLQDRLHSVETQLEQLES